LKKLNKIIHWIIARDHNFIHLWPIFLTSSQIYLIFDQKYFAWDQSYLTLWTKFLASNQGFLIFYQLYFAWDQNFLALGWWFPMNVFHLRFVFFPQKSAANLTKFAKIGESMFSNPPTLFIFFEALRHSTNRIRQ